MIQAGNEPKPAPHPVTSPTRSPQAILQRCFLYGFLDTARLHSRDPVAMTRQLLAGGADILQLRAKDLAPARILALARRLLPLTRAAGIPLIINDFPEIAHRAGADGVHLGQEDLFRHSVAAARAKLGRGKLIGLSTHSVEQALAANQLQPDYLGLGPIFATGTKPLVQPIGLEPIGPVTTGCTLPFFCIGGINEHNLDLVLAAGARRVAVVSGILNADDPAGTARRLKQRLMAAR